MRRQAKCSLSRFELQASALHQSLDDSATVLDTLEVLEVDRVGGAGGVGGVGGVGQGAGWRFLQTPHWMAFCNIWCCSWGQDRAVPEYEYA